MTPKEDSSAVFWKSWLMTTLACSPRLSSITMRVFSSDSSRRSRMPSISFSETSSAIRVTRLARFTLYGISVMTICSMPPFISSVCALPRMRTMPRPVLR